MLAFLPIAALILIVLALWRAQGPKDAPREDVRDALAPGLLIWGVLIVVLTETLSAAEMLRSGWIAAGWALVVLRAGLALAVRIRREAKISGRFRMPPAISLSRLDSILLAAMVTALGLMLVVAIASPPQEGDALAYHMGRVAHWAQNQSLEPYATPDARQLWASPWTEFAVLHLYVLAGSDQWVNLVGWMSLALSAVVATRMAGMAGARSTGQLLSGLFVVTLPIAIPQASSVLTDVPVALWVLLTAWVVVSSATGPAGSRCWIWLGPAVGLGMLTKGSYLAYGAVLVAWFLGLTLRRLGLRVALARGLVIGCIGGALLIPQALRNREAFGSLLGWPEAIADHSNAQVGLLSLISNSARSSSLLLTAPSPAWNGLIEKGVFWLHIHVLGLQPSDPDYTLAGRTYGLGWAWPGTNSAPVHALVAVIAVVLLAVMARGSARRLALSLAACAIAGFLIFGAAFAWQGAARFHVPLMVLLAPVAGAGLDRLRHPGWSAAAAAALLLASAPAILAMPSRPLIPIQPSTQTTSVLRASRDQLLFRGEAHLLDATREIAAEVGATGCRQIGLMIDSSDLEYGWWAVLGRIPGPMRIEHLHAAAVLENYLDPAFSPCAVICTICTEATGPVRGLPLRMAREGILLYSRP